MLYIVVFVTSLSYWQVKYRMIVLTYAGNDELTNEGNVQC